MGVEICPYHYKTLQMIPILTKIEIKEISEQIAKYAEQLITEKLAERMDS